MKSKKTTSKQQKPSNAKKGKRKQPMARKKQNISTHITTPTSQHKERSKLTSSMKRLDASKRQKWVDLNKKQTDFLANAINSAISFVISTIEVESAEKFEMQNTVLNAARSVLMQNVKKVKVPPTKTSVAKTNLISKATYINISENMDATINYLNEAINEEEKLVKKKEKLLKK